VKNLFKNFLATFGWALRRLPPPTRVGRVNWIEDAAILLGKPPQTIFDVGANVGQTTAALSKTFPRARVFAIEPSPDAFHALSARYQSQPNIELQNIAFGETNGSCEFFMNSCSETNSLLPATPEAAQWFGELVRAKQRTTVPVQRLDDFCADRKITQIDLLKMDTQGYEAHVLRGAEGMLREKRVRVICTEVLFEPQYTGQTSFPELYTLIRSHGFAFAALYDQGYSEDNRLLSANALFFRASAA
jgi:FkbM family methyltransferase